MKTRITLFTGLLAFIFILSACKDKTFKKYNAYIPVYTSYEEFRKSAEFMGPQSISAEGQIYIKDQYLFIIEPEKGVHFIDNSSPASPQKVGFLNLSGCTGIEIKNQFLYANSFIDLVVFDISSFTNPTEITRVKDAFPEALPFYADGYPFSTIDKEKGVVTSWEIGEVKEEVENYPHWTNCFQCESTVTFNSGQGATGSPSQGQGISGSITKFTLINDYLYFMGNRRLIPFDISVPNQPESFEGVSISREVETLFAYNQHIFMGTTTGMLIYSTQNPSQPSFVSVVSHMTACDPVVVKDDYAYVTVRSGRTCGGVINQLDVINISDYSTPYIEASYEMNNPHGLGIDNNLLFICDGSSGLKVFDATNPVESGNNLLHVFNDVSATDIIPFNNVAIVIGETSIRQYDYSNVEQLTLLSSIPILP